MLYTGFMTALQYETVYTKLIIEEHSATVLEKYVRA